jgi:hypothetical protein
MDNLKDKIKAKVGDGQPTIAIEDIRDRSKTPTILLAKLSPKTRAKLKAKVNRKRIAKESQTLRKGKEKDEVKENRDSGMNAKKNPK